MKIIVNNASILAKHVQMVFHVLHVLRVIMAHNVNTTVIRVLADFAVITQENAPIHVLQMNISRLTIPDKDASNVLEIVPVARQLTGVHRVLMVILETFARRSAYLHVIHALAGIVVIRALQNILVGKTVINASVTKTNVPGETETFVKNVLIRLGIPIQMAVAHVVLTAKIMYVPLIVHVSIVLIRSMDHIAN